MRRYYCLSCWDQSAGFSRCFAKGNLRKCPFCAENIKPEAKVCRDCRREISTNLASQAPRHHHLSCQPTPRQRCECSTMRAQTRLEGRYRCRLAMFSPEIALSTTIRSFAQPSHKSGSVYATCCDLYAKKRTVSALDAQHSLISQNRHRGIKQPDKSV